jgi:hypothetical protein
MASVFTLLLPTFPTSRAGCSIDFGPSEAINLIDFGVKTRGIYDKGDVEKVGNKSVRDE